MKKTSLKKLRLFRETLQILPFSEIEKAIGGSFSCLSGVNGCSDCTVSGSPTDNC